MIRFLQTSGASKALLAVVIGALCVGMVMYLGQAFVPSNAVNEVGVYATVGGEKITSQQISSAADRIGKQMFPSGFPQQFQGYLNKRAADQLVTQAALVAEARKLGLSVSDAEVAQELHSGQFGEVFFPGGKFIGQQQYEEIISSNTGLSVKDFEASLKKDLLLRKLLAVVGGTVSVSPDEVRKEYIKQNTKVTFDYAVLSAADLAKQVVVNDTELRAYYDAHKAQIKDSFPEQRKARYVVIDPSKVQVQISDDDYKKVYEQNKALYQDPEQVDVRHILISTQNNKRSDADALKIAQDVKKQLGAGADFATLAKKYSDDPGSKDNGGLYKNVVKGQMVKEFNDAAFSLKPGQISDPIKTTFGYHIIKVDAHREARTKPLDEVKPQIEQSVRAEKTAEQLDKLSEDILTSARTMGLDKAAAKYNLNIITTDYFTQQSSLPGIGASKAFMQQAYAEKPNSPPEKVALENHGYAILQVTDSKPARTPTFEESHDQLAEQFKREKASQMLEQKTKELADRAKSTHDLKAAAKAVGATVKTSDLVASNAQVPDLGEMSGPANVVFSMNKGDISGPISSGGTGAVLQLVEKQEPGAADAAAHQAQLRDQLVQQKRNDMVQFYAESVRDKMQKSGAIKINPTVAKGLFGPTA